VGEEEEVPATPIISLADMTTVKQAIQAPVDTEYGLTRQEAQEGTGLLLVTEPRAEEDSLRMGPQTVKAPAMVPEEKPS